MKTYYVSTFSALLLTIASCADSVTPPDGSGGSGGGAQASSGSSSASSSSSVASSSSSSSSVSSSGSGQCKPAVTCDHNEPGQCANLDDGCGQPLNCHHHCGPLGKSFLGCDTKTNLCVCLDATNIPGAGAGCAAIGLPSSSASLCVGREVGVPTEDVPEPPNVPDTCVYTNKLVTDPMLGEFQLWCCP